MSARLALTCALALLALPALAREDESDAGLYVLLGGGLDGYTGALGDAVTVGPGGGALVGVKNRYVGLEASYTVGGVNAELPAAQGEGLDVVRNSPQLAVTAGLLDEPLQPFFLGGVGVDFYDVKRGEAVGFEDDTSVFVPVGGGLRYNLTSLLTADARFSYNFLLGDNFAPGDPGGQRYQALLTLGGTY